MSYAEVRCAIVSIRRHTVQQLGQAKTAMLTAHPADRAGGAIPRA